jgi:hypothetical protein
MSPDAAPDFALLARGLAVLLGLALLALGAWRVRLKRTVGAPKVAGRPGRRLRALYHAAAVLAAALAFFGGLAVPLAPACAVLALGVVLVALAPGEQDSTLGSAGVQHGWHARRFAELEEWRLTGDHLRWRLFGEWVATEAPAALHGELRALLVAANPGGESRFQR